MGNFLYKWSDKGVGWVLIGHIGELACLPMAKDMVAPALCVGGTGAWPPDVVARGPVVRARPLYNCCKAPKSIHRGSTGKLCPRQKVVVVPDHFL
jgi:hypothetical protein